VLVEETFARSRLVRITPGVKRRSRKMRTIRRRNWLLKRIALGLAVAAVSAPVAQASVDEGIAGQPNSPAEVVQVFAYADHGLPSAMPSEFALARGDHIELVRAQGRSTGDGFVASDYGMPRPTATDYAISRGDLIEVVRATPNGTSSDKIEFVRTQPRSIGEPQVVAAGFDWKDAGIGAGLALALVLLGGGAALASRHLGRAQTA
jgi:hypothetical protein